MANKGFGFGMMVLALGCSMMALAPDLISAQTTDAEIKKIWEDLDQEDKETFIMAGWKRHGGSPDKTPMTAEENELADTFYIISNAYGGIAWRMQQYQSYQNAAKKGARKTASMPTVHKYPAGSPDVEKLLWDETVKYYANGPARAKANPVAYSHLDIVPERTAFLEAEWSENPPVRNALGVITERSRRANIGIFYKEGNKWFMRPGTVRNEYDMGNNKWGTKYSFGVGDRGNNDVEITNYKP